MDDDQSFSSRVISSFLYSGIGNTVSKVINVVALFVVLKLISPEAFGIASIVLAIFAVVQAVTEMGLGIAIVQVDDLSRREIDSLFWLSLMLTGVLYLIIYLGAPFVMMFYDQPVLTSLIQVHGLIVVIFTFYFVPRNMLKRELLFKEIAIIDNVALLASSIIMVILAYYDFGVWAIILGEVSNRAGRFVLSQIYYPFWPKLQFNWPEIKPHVEFGLYATGSRLLYNLYSNADYLIVGRVFGAEAVGIYTFAYRIVSDTVKTLITNINEVVYPAFARLQNQIQRLQKYFFTIARTSLQLISIVLIIIALYIDEILLIAGYNEWMDAVPLIQLLSVVAVLRTVSPLVPQLLNAMGKSRLNFYYSLSNAIIMPAAFLIGSQFSLMGVGYAWLIGYPLVVLLLFYFGSQLLEVSLFSFLARSFSGIWLIPLLLILGYGVQALFTPLAGSYTFVIPLTGIFVVCGVGFTILYYREKDTIDLIRGKRKVETNNSEE